MNKFPFISATRSSKMEKRFRRNEDNKRFDMAEKFYNEANDEIEKEDKATRQTMDLPTQSLKEIDNGEDLWKLLEISHDAELFEVRSFQLFPFIWNTLMFAFFSIAQFNNVPEAASTRPSNTNE